MKTETSVVEVIQLQIVREQAKYRNALRAEKPFNELTEIKNTIDFLRGCLKRIQDNIEALSNDATVAH